MSRRLVLIAHAATAATRRAAFPNDDGLDDLGCATTQALAARLPRADRILTSPARAAHETAAALGGMAPIVEEELRDLDVGRWVGRSLADLDGTDGAAWIADPHFVGHGGEAIAACCERVATWLAASLSVEGVTIGITHGAVVRAALLAVLEAPPAAFWRVDVAPLTRLTLSSDGRRWALRGLETPAAADRNQT